MVFITRAPPRPTRATPSKTSGPPMRSFYASVQQWCLRFSWWSRSNALVTPLDFPNGNYVVATFSSYFWVLVYICGGRFMNWYHCLCSNTEMFLFETNVYWILKDLIIFLICFDSDGWTNARTGWRWTDGRKREWPETDGRTVRATERATERPTERPSDRATEDGHNSSSRRPFETLTSAFYTIFQN